MEILSGGDSVGDLLIDTAVEGGVGAAGIYGFDKFAAPALTKVVGSFGGSYTPAIEGFIYSLVLRFIGKKIGSDVAYKMLDYAAASAFAKSIAVDTLKDPIAPAPAAGKKGWGALTSHALTYGAETRY
jgi:hypothetical protein